MTRTDARAYRIVVRVAETRAENGRARCKLYRPGDEFDMSIPAEKEKICRWAYNSMFPIMSALEFDGSLPWEPDFTLVSCPNPHNLVVFELRKEGERDVDWCCW
ncbi:MAG: TIGR04076 family protein, partial [Candidatus Thorarchaeota archaeon]